MVPNIYSDSIIKMMSLDAFLFVQNFQKFKNFKKIKTIQTECKKKRIVFEKSDFLRSRLAHHFFDVFFFFVRNSVQTIIKFVI